MKGGHLVRYLIGNEGLVATVTTKPSVLGTSFVFKDVSVQKGDGQPLTRNMWTSFEALFADLKLKLDGDGTLHAFQNGVELPVIKQN